MTDVINDGGEPSFSAPFLSELSPEARAHALGITQHMLNEIGSFRLSILLNYTGPGEVRIMANPAHADFCREHPANAPNLPTVAEVKQQLAQMIRYVSRQKFDLETTDATVIQELRDNYNAGILRMAARAQRESQRQQSEQNYKRVTYNTTLLTATSVHINGLKVAIEKSRVSVTDKPETGEGKFLNPSLVDAPSVVNRSLIPGITITATKTAQGYTITLEPTDPAAPLRIKPAELVGHEAELA